MYWKWWIDLKCLDVKEVADITKYGHYMYHGNNLNINVSGT